MLKKTNSLKACCALFLLSGFMACKKNSSNDDGDVKNSFTDKRWKLEAMSINPAVDLDDDGIPDSDLTKFMDACDKDDITIFRKNQKVVTNYGPLKCNDEPQEEEIGTWSYQESTKKLTLQEEGEPALVVEVTESASGRFAFKYASPDNPAYTIRITYKL